MSQSIICKLNNDTYKIGSYEIYLDNQIGTGGYSCVYAGRCIDDILSNKMGINNKKRINGITIDNAVAVKKIIAKNLSYRHQKLLWDEVKIMQLIKMNPNPNIVTCYDVIDDLDTVYIIMEYCDSGNLAKLVGKPMKEDLIRHYFSQLVNGIKYLDDYKIIHRDIKPRNLLLTDNNKILKICDFGLAKNKTDSKNNTICGSPLYMAPEIFKNKSYDDTVDYWSIGIILYEMIYGINPLNHIKDFHELENFMIDDSKFINIPTKKSKNKKISNECLELLKSLLTKNSEERIKFNELYTNKWLFDNEKTVDMERFMNDSNDEDSASNSDNSNSLHDSDNSMFKIDV